MIFKKEYFDQIKSEAEKFVKTCYVQSYAFLLLAALNKNILRLKDVCVIWRSPISHRRYSSSLETEDDIFRQYIEYIKFAEKKGFIYNQNYLDEAIKLKEFNIFYTKRNYWKGPIKFFLAKCKLDRAFNLFLYFLRHLKYLIGK